MDLSALSSSAPAATPAVTAQAEDTTAISSDFETFLRMLTVQMQNQDPLNPVQSEDFAVQLATFSAVEQQVRTNDLLVALGEQIGGGLSDLAGWVGMEVRAAVPAAFDGAPVHLTLGPAPAGANRVLVVRSADGAEVQRLALAAGETALQWTGIVDDGTQLPDGVYSFEAESYDGEALLSVEPVETYAKVTEARMEPGGAVLATEGGGSVATGQVTAIRAPQA